MLDNFYKGIQFGLGFIFILGLVFGLVWASGWHTADEIFGGIFSGNFTFQDNVTFKGNVYGLSTGKTIIDIKKTCDSLTIGEFYYNSTLEQIQFCNGNEWFSIKINPLGETCKDILDSGLSTGDGMYPISPGGYEAFYVYCDMTHQGGGWTLIANHADNLIPTRKNYVNLTEYGVLSEFRWQSLRDSMKTGMMFIDENNKITYISKTKLENSDCIPIQDTNSLVTENYLWYKETSGCLDGGSDYSIIKLANSGEGASLYQMSTVKFDIWPYSSYSYSYNEQDKLLYFIK